MTVKFKVVQGAAPTSATTQDFTSSGFGTPKAAIFLIGRGTANGTVADTFNWGLGFTDGTTSHSASVMCEHNAGVADSKRSQQQGELLHIMSDTGALDGAATFDSWITDGVRIDWSGNALTNAHLVTCILIGGSDVTANVGLTRITTGTNVAHGVGAIPDLFFLATTTASADGISNDAGLSLGVYTYDGSADTQYYMSAFDNDGYDPTSTANILISGKVAGSINASGVNRDYQITAEDSTNLTFTRSGASFGIDPLWLAISFGSATNKVEIVEFAIPTSTGTGAIDTVGSWKPQFAMLFATDNTSYAHSATVDCSQHIGVLDDTNEYSVSAGNEDAATTTIAKSLSANKALDTIKTSDGSYKGATGTVHTGSGSIDADGITIDWTATTYSVAAKGIAIMVEEDAAGLDLTATLVNVAVADVNTSINATRNLTATLVNVTAADVDATINATRDLLGTLVDVAAADVDAVVNATRNLTATIVDAVVADIDATVGFGADLDVTATLVDLAVADIDAATNLSHLLLANAINVSVADVDATVGLDLDVTASLVDISVADLGASVGLSRNLTATLTNLSVADIDATVATNLHLLASEAAVLVAALNATVTLAGEEGAVDIQVRRALLTLIGHRR